MICLLRVCARGVLCVIAVCYVTGSGLFHGVVWCGLVCAWSGRVPCLPEALPLLTPCARVIWSCGLVMRSGRVSPGVRQVHGLVVIILPYNTKH